MKHVVLVASVVALTVLSGEVPAAAASPYAGQEVREIKALSESDVADLLAGKGRGYAKAAELNGYPGPGHVLELAEELELTAEQRTETQALFNRMQASAKELGAELVAAERTLDELFRNQAIDPSSLSELVTKIGRLESRLREAHLNAHLHQTRLLSAHQVAKYMLLRGYGHGGQEHRHQQHHGGRS
jgi:Spy/CpxP family protein refolding chaperone